jgi:hypothetical protein
MNLLKNEERIELLKNLLSDPDDWISREILRLSDEDEDEETPEGPMGISNSTPVANKTFPKGR